MPIHDNADAVRTGYRHAPQDQFRGRLTLQIRVSTSRSRRATCAASPGCRVMGSTNMLRSQPPMKMLGSPSRSGATVGVGGALAEERDADARRHSLRARTSG